MLGFIIIDFYYCMIFTILYDFVILHHFYYITSSYLSQCFVILQTLLLQYFYYITSSYLSQCF
ncbi:hypothetical protein DD089_16120, partial [Clostridioides difficile]|nr:hypothetical protein [Clostridioides difficile]